MKQIVLAPLLAILLVACGGNSKNTAEGETSKAKNEEHNEYENEDETGDAPVVNAICLWKELSLRAEPGSEGKWLTNVLMGENMEYLGEDEVLSEGGKDVTYNKVALADGTQ
ncbi:hypothetical protein GC194_13110, partial [bacterium]|nr:hypothetical protein [bacterium]